MLFLTDSSERWICQIGLQQWLGAHNSAVECHLHTVEVVGSNPAVPTI